MYGNNYYRWFPLKPNQWGLLHVFHDKRKEKFWLVHATGQRFPIKNCKVILRSCT